MRVLMIIAICSVLASCSKSVKHPISMENNVDLNRFMGKWYVIANIPTFIEEGAHNAIESYSMNDDGTINTTFTFNKDDFNGELKTYNPTGFVSDESNSLWGMQFIWPFKAEFIIAYLSEDYEQTIIARNARDYLWIMARSPEISDETYQYLIMRCKDMGYNVDEIQRVPHSKSVMDSSTEFTKETI